MRYLTILLVGEGQNLNRAKATLDYPEYFGVEWVPSAEDALAWLEKLLFDIVVVGGSLESIANAIKRIRERSPNVPVLALPCPDAEPELAERLRTIGGARCLPPASSGPELREALLASCP